MPAVSISRDSSALRAYPETLAEASIRLFAKEVLPEVNKLGQIEPNLATAG